MYFFRVRLPPIYMFFSQNLRTPTCVHLFQVFDPLYKNTKILPLFSYKNLSPLVSSVAFSHGTHPWFSAIPPEFFVWGLISQGERARLSVTVFLQIFKYPFPPSAYFDVLFLSPWVIPLLRDPSSLVF